MRFVFPQKLKKGDEIRVIAPSRSLSLLTSDIIESAKRKLEQEGYKITFSKNCKELDILKSSSVKSRIEDLHQAFKDKKVKAVLTVIGGFNSNELLPYIDYELIKNNPKILCGYSDITALANTITAKTGLVTYSGLHFSTFAMKKGFEYNLDYFNKCLTQNDKYIIKPSEEWSDDSWYKDQEKRVFEKNEGYVVINKGEGEGVIYGGNLCTFNLLQGTKFMPNLSNSVLFIEDDDMAGSHFDVEFSRNLQSLIQQPNFEKVKGLVFGRFQKKTQMSIDKLKYIIKNKKELKSIPIIANADFGHTNPLFTFPIGGYAKIITKKNQSVIEILKH